MFIGGKWVDQTGADDAKVTGADVGSEGDTGDDNSGDTGDTGDGDQTGDSGAGDTGGDTGDNAGEGDAKPEDGKGDADKARQSAEENARQAEGRRRREAAAAEAQRLAAAEVASLLAELGLKDEDGAPITTPEKAREFAERRKVEKLNENLRSGELTVDDIALLRGSPIGQVPAVPQVPAAPGPDVTTIIAEQLTRIATEFDPKIKGIDDILAMDTGDAFQALVRAGQDFYGAYKLANAEAIAEARASAKLRQQQQNTASKAHLQSSKGKSGDAVLTPPRDVVATYKQFFPEATEDEIARIYTERKRAKK
jgi:hypothetical protein